MAALAPSAGSTRRECSVSVAMAAGDRQEIIKMFVLLWLLSLPASPLTLRLPRVQ